MIHYAEQLLPQQLMEYIIQVDRYRVLWIAMLFQIIIFPLQAQLQFIFCIILLLQGFRISATIMFPIIQVPAQVLFIACIMLQLRESARLLIFRIILFRTKIKQLLQEQVLFSEFIRVPLLQAQ